MRYIHSTLFSVSFDLCSSVTKKGIERGTETTESFRIPCALKNRPASVLDTLRLSIMRRIRTWCILVCKYFPRPPEQGAQTDTVCTGALPFTVTSFSVRKEFSCNDNVLRTLRCEVRSWCSKLKGILPLYHCYVIELIGSVPCLKTGSHSTSEIFPAFVKSEVSTPCSQECAIGPIRRHTNPV